MTNFYTTPATVCCDLHARCSTGSRSFDGGNKPMMFSRTRWSNCIGLCAKSGSNRYGTSSIWRRSKSVVNCSIWPNIILDRRAALQTTTPMVNPLTRLAGRSTLQPANPKTSKAGVSSTIKSNVCPMTNKRSSTLSFTKDYLRKKLPSC